MRSLCKYFAVSCVLVILGLAAFAQPASPTTNILMRISMVQSRFGRGSIFSIDVDQREYWITAKHVLNGRLHPPYGTISEKSVVLEILNPKGDGEQWLHRTFSVIDPGNDIDIAVLAAEAPVLTNPISSMATGADRLSLGGDCEFLGFPYGGGWRIGTGDQGMWMPFVKHCTVSAMTLGSPRVWVLDGINNEGFSGGPVVFGTGLEQKVFAVVSGYVTEPAEVVPYGPAGLAPDRQRHDGPPARPADNKAEGREKVDVNSGFILAFDIQYAIDAIKKNPIGPLRPAK